MCCAWRCGQARCGLLGAGRTYAGAERRQATDGGVEGSDGPRRVLRLPRPTIAEEMCLRFGSPCLPVCNMYCVVWCVCAWCAHWKKESASQASKHGIVQARRLEGTHEDEVSLPIPLVVPQNFAWRDRLFTIIALFESSRSDIFPLDCFFICFICFISHLHFIRHVFPLPF